MTDDVTRNSDGYSDASLTGNPGESISARSVADDSPPLVARTREELAKALAELRRPVPGAGGQRGDGGEAAGSAKVALVPTMGALHEGHLSLIREAREQADVLVVSIFVNPLQFGPGEDFERYPRSFDADLRACRREGVALVYAPPLDVMYPQEPVVRVSAGAMGQRLEGRFRPGHFEGVLTVVLKLLQLVGPDIAVFGQKDAQQLALVRRMVADLDLPVRIVVGPTVRDSDGLAISSRNAYLSPAQRRKALALSQALRAGEDAAAEGPGAVLRQARSALQGVGEVEVDYVALVRPADFADAARDHRGPAVLAVAARVGSTRLIDNVPMTVG